MISKKLSNDRIQIVREKLNNYIIRTPILFNPNNISEELNTEIILKLEFLQHGGTFKIRGALNNILNLSDKPSVNSLIGIVDVFDDIIKSSFIILSIFLYNSFLISKSSTIASITQSVSLIKFKFSSKLPRSNNFIFEFKVRGLGLIFNNF